VKPVKINWNKIVEEKKTVINDKQKITSSRFQSLKDMRGPAKFGSDCGKFLILRSPKHYRGSGSVCLVNNQIRITRDSEAQTAKMASKLVLESKTIILAAVHQLKDHQSYHWSGEILRSQVWVTSKITASAPEPKPRFGRLLILARKSHIRIITACIIQPQDIDQFLAPYQ